MQRRFVTTRRDKTGLPPGTPIHVGSRPTDPVRFTVFQYGPDSCTEHSPPDAAACTAIERNAPITWINVDGVYDVTAVTQICSALGVHPLVQEDIVNTDQRPKAEDYGSYLYVVLRMLRSLPNGDPAGTPAIVAEQVSLIVMEGLVVSFQEHEGDVFEAVRERLRSGKGSVRRKGPDYLAYCLMDAIVDHYFILLEHIEGRIEPLEEAVVSDPNSDAPRAIQALKRDLLVLRRTLWPLREMIYRLSREGAGAITDDTRVFMRDLYDHVIHVIDLIETFQELAAGTMDIYLSSISNRMNNIMKVLTIISTIFIPLTFIAGIYGMNFSNMPELEWRWAYPVTLAGMAAIALVMLRFFRKKGWI
ncbi:MAG: magnesium and cobalt transport protein CorA [Spirochaetaceae bacterium]|nr:MAG: magnesium and cobalt transport protein CorA [Spirochaetaceae bacterium]